MAVSSEGASAALTIPIVNSLTHFLRNTAEDDEGVQTMKRKILSALNTRFASMETNKLYVLPTMLDPRFKVFSSSVAVIQARQCLTEEFILLQSASAEASSELADPPSSKWCHSDHVSDEQSTLRSSFDSMIATGEETDAELMLSLSSAEVKIESYLQEPNQPRNCSPLAFWQEKQALYPILAKMAVKYLSIPAASVASERLFSTARHIITDQCNCLDPERAEMLLFLNKNLRLFL